VSPLSVDPNRISESVGHRRITVRVRFPRIAFLFACAVSLALPLAAQSPMELSTAACSIHPTR
jgi:hypothetical protein